MNTAIQNRPIEGWQSLTEAESAVADLVARGLTNRDVGAELFVSRHTVDCHLRQIYRKLHITSRVSLARLSTERLLGASLDHQNVTARENASSLATAS